jgi:hypothetical protein
MILFVKPGNEKLLNLDLTDYNLLEEMAVCKI